MARVSHHHEKYMNPGITLGAESLRTYLPTMYVPRVYDMLYNRRNYKLHR